MTPPVEASPRPRALPRSLAAVVEALELDQAHLVTTSEIEALRRRAGIATPAKVVADRLRKHGWLLPTPRRGVYEFAPGAHAGPLSRGDATTPLQAALHARPDLAAGLTLQSAAWALGAADRTPARLEIAAGDREVARSLNATLAEFARVLVFAPRLPKETRRGVPVLAAESVAVHMATRPRDVRSWGSALEWLPDLTAELDWENLQVEIQSRPSAVVARLGYLLSGLRPDLAAQMAPAAGKVYFGGRGPLLRHDARWQIADTLLPFDPRSLPVAA